MAGTPRSWKGTMTPPAGVKKREGSSKRHAADRKGHPRMSFEELINQISAERGWPYRHLGETAVRIDLDLGRGRKQQVFLETFEEESEELVRIRTIVGPASRLSVQQLQYAMGMNAHMRYGAFAIDGKNLCLVDSHLLRDADPDQVAESVRFLGRRADFCEEYVYKTDAH